MNDTEISAISKNSPKPKHRRIFLLSLLFFSIGFFYLVLSLSIELITGDDYDQITGFIFTFLLGFVFLALAGLLWANFRLRVTRRIQLFFALSINRLKTVKWYWWVSIACGIWLVWISINIYWKIEIEQYADDVKNEIKLIMGDDFVGLAQKKNAYSVLANYKGFIELKDYIDNDFEPVVYRTYTEDELIEEFALAILSRKTGVDEEGEEQELTLDEKFERFKKKRGLELLGKLQELRDYEVLAHPYFYSFDIKTLHVDGLIVSSYGFFREKHVFANFQAIIRIIEFAADYYMKKEEWGEFNKIYDLAFHMFEMLYVADGDSMVMKCMLGEFVASYAQLNLARFKPDRIEALSNALIKTSQRLDKVRKLQFLFFNLYIYSNYKMKLHNKHIARYYKLISVFPTMNFHFYMEKTAYYYSNYMSDKGEKDPDAPEDSYDYVSQYFWGFSLSNGAFRLYYPFLVKSDVGFYENMAQIQMSLLPFHFNEYRNKIGAYPTTFNQFKDIIQGKKVTDDSFEFAGYKFSFIRKFASDEGKEVNDINKARYALYAVPLDYGTTGEFTFIVNEEGLVYSRDRGMADPVEEYPENPEESNWER